MTLPIGLRTHITGFFDHLKSSAFKHADINYKVGEGGGGGLINIYINTLQKKAFAATDE